MCINDAQPEGFCIENQYSGFAIINTTFGSGGCIYIVKYFIVKIGY